METSWSRHWVARWGLIVERGGSEIGRLKGSLEGGGSVLGSQEGSGVGLGVWPGKFC